MEQVLVGPWPCVTECERCKKVGADVRARDSQTMYEPKALNAWTRLLLDDELHGVPEEPNRDLMLCDECAEEYDKYMDEMWKAYHGSLL